MDSDVSSPKNDELNDIDIARFQREGYLVLKSVLSPRACELVLQRVQKELNPLVGPIEYEADVGYPGAPESRSQPGGETPRRLLHAYTRGEDFRSLALNPRVTGLLRKLLHEDVYLTQCHHNCIMTKYPGYSSATAWHQDIRYWSFDEPDLITAWFALDDEHRAKGALRVIPGSHRVALDRGRLDKDLFLRTELGENKHLIRSAISIELKQGDVLLFHSRLFHAAGKNRTDGPKFSAVFSYHAADNQPIPGTRSATLPSIKVAP